MKTGGVGGWVGGRGVLGRSEDWGGVGGVGVWVGDGVC